MLGRSLLLQVGYVGSAAHRLMTTADINQPASPEALATPASCRSSAAQQASRPFFAQFPDFGIINQIETYGNSNYNSLPVRAESSRMASLHFQFTYT